MATKHSRDTAVTCELLASTGVSAAIETLDIALPEEVLLQFPALRPLQQIVDMRKRQKDTEANLRSWTRYQSLEIEQWEYKVSWNQLDESQKRIQAWYFPDRNAKNARLVLLEWKYYSGESSTNKNLAVERVERVAQLLSASSKPAELRILDCVGYFQDDLKSRFGILYDMPQVTLKTTTGSGKSSVVTLRQLLGATDPKVRPPLGARFVLAKMLANAMLEFHLGFWLHKDFNAENIIFFLPDGLTLPQTDITAPYVASFGLSRPDHDVLVSEVVASDPTPNTLLEFAYHHPA